MKKLLLITMTVVLLLAGCTAEQVKQPPGGIAYFTPKYEVVSQTDQKLIIEVRNQNTTVATYNYSSGQRYDFRLSRNGEVVYTWSADKSFILVTSVSTVKQGESEVYTVNLTDLPVEKGTYQLEFYSVAKELTEVEHLKLNITIK